MVARDGACEGSQSCHEITSCSDVSEMCPCPSGYQSKNCSVDVDECELTMCSNGGTCVNTEGSYRCECEFPFYGETCELECANYPCDRSYFCIKGSVPCGCLCYDVAAKVAMAAFFLLILFCIFCVKAGFLLTNDSRVDLIPRKDALRGVGRHLKQQKDAFVHTYCCCVSGGARSRYEGNPLFNRRVSAGAIVHSRNGVGGDVHDSGPHPSRMDNEEEDIFGIIEESSIFVVNPCSSPSTLFLPSNYSSAIPSQDFLWAVWAQGSDLSASDVDTLVTEALTTAGDDISIMSDCSTTGMAFGERYPSPTAGTFHYPPELAATYGKQTRVTT